MKQCNNCGYTNITNTVDKLAVVQNALLQKDKLNKEDVLEVAEQLDLAERQVRNYIKVIKEHGYEDAIQKIEDGYSINQLSCTTASSRSARCGGIPTQKAFEILKESYSITLEELESFLEGFYNG